MDAEETWHADFKAGKGVDAQPSFIPEHIDGLMKALRVDYRSAEPTWEYHPPSTPLLYTKQEVEMGEENVLVCHVTGFYPAPVSFFWTKNGENVTEGTSFPIPFLSKEGSFSQFSRLEFTPQLGDIYSCGVQHLALDQPLNILGGAGVSARRGTSSLLCSGSDGGSPGSGCWDLLPDQRERVQLSSGSLHHMIT
ncbi:hypothetical protein F7725_001400 [Dissostichus mawsoni]|uniref:Ig-like domain-containing protein n=1 Tax=Dissostichus mawsoni TaxID=36200 RepID=A0A7J5ZH82_DISMA|nr:hypothetical protein F7725_001400 [Dissostichus mawsoni]